MEVNCPRLGEDRDFLRYQTKLNIPLAKEFLVRTIQFGSGSTFQESMASEQPYAWIPSS